MFTILENVVCYANWLDTSNWFPFSGFHFVGKTTHLVAKSLGVLSKWVDNNHLIIYLCGMFPVAYYM